MAIIRMKYKLYDEIVSYAREHLNSFHIEDDAWTKEDLRIYSEEYYF